VSELPLEAAAVLGERLPVQMEPLENDRCAVLELGEDALDVRRAGERLRPPRQILRV
jgi:hypothetical protein